MSSGAKLAEGQEVLAAPEEGAASDHASALIGTKIDVYEASLVHLVLVHETGDVEVLHTTDEHPFHVVETETWTRADRLRVGDGLSTISGVAELVGISFGRETVPVYNLSIPATPTYYVGEYGVWVHNANCPTIRNVHLAGSFHPITKVPFDKHGFPIFDRWAEKTVALPGGHQGRRVDSSAADRQAGISAAYRQENGLSWHHHQDGIRMQLVPTDIHVKTGHTGSRPGQ